MTEKKIMRKLAILIISILLLSASCEKEPAENTDESARLTIFFTHIVGGINLVMDTMMYNNAAGNPYLVNEIQYFISDVSLHRNDGESILLDAWEGIHYVDSDLPHT